jgi:hypothetical protein
MLATKLIAQTVATFLLGGWIAFPAPLKAAGNRDFVLRILPKANHSQFEAKVGSNAETPILRRFAPTCFTTILDWLAKRMRASGRLGKGCFVSLRQNDGLSK